MREAREKSDEPLAPWARHHSMSEYSCTLPYVVMSYQSLGEVEELYLARY